MADIWLSIGTVAERAGLAPSALRFYEDRGLIASRRSSGGTRRYPRSVLRRLAFIQVAQRVGLSLNAIKAALDSLAEDTIVPDAAEWRRLSTAWRPLLDERIRLLEALRDQLDSCIGCGCLSLDHCALRNPEDTAGRLGTGPRCLLGDNPLASPATAGPIARGDGAVTSWPRPSGLPAGPSGRT